MKILLIGKNDQVGWEAQRSLLPLGIVNALGRDNADLSKPDNLRAVVREHKPDVIVCAAAFTAVDKTEEEEALATAINGTAVGVLAEEAKNEMQCLSTTLQTMRLAAPKRFHKPKRMNLIPSMLMVEASLLVKMLYKKRTVIILSSVPVGCTRHATEILLRPCLSLQQRVTN